MKGPRPRVGNWGMLFTWSPSIDSLKQKSICRRLQEGNCKNKRRFHIFMVVGFGINLTCALGIN